MKESDSIKELKYEIWILKIRESIFSLWGSEANLLEIRNKEKKLKNLIRLKKLERINEFN